MVDKVKAYFESFSRKNITVNMFKITHPYNTSQHISASTNHLQTHPTPLCKHRLQIYPWSSNECLLYPWCNILWSLTTEQNKTKQKQRNKTKKNLFIALPTSQRPLFTPHILPHMHLTALIAFLGYLPHLPPSLICQLMLVLMFVPAMSIIISNYIF